jgi:hypothetical protein
MNKPACKQVCSEARVLSIIILHDRRQWHDRDASQRYWTHQRKQQRAHGQANLQKKSADASVPLTYEGANGEGLCCCCQLLRGEQAALHLTDGQVVATSILRGAQAKELQSVITGYVQLQHQL